jgi:aerobic carbon-monoxide dehydrogenase small subunit
VNVEIALTVNGEPYRLSVDVRRTLLEVLREQLELTGTKLGCSYGVCGACTVLVDGKAMNACLILAPQADGAEILTVEGLATGGDLDALQRAFVERGAFQCGFCTPGFLMSAHALLRDGQPTEAEIRRAFVGNLCRCTGYVKYVEAVQSVVGAPAERA